MKFIKRCLQILASVALTATLFSLYSYYEYNVEWQSQRSPGPPLTHSFDLSKTSDFIRIPVPSDPGLKSSTGFSIWYAFEERDEPLDPHELAHLIPYNGNFEIQIRDAQGKILKDELISKMYQQGQYVLTVGRVDNVNPKRDYMVYARTLKGDSQLTGRHFVLEVYPIVPTIPTSGMGGLLYFSVFYALGVFWLLIGGLFLVYKFVNRKEERA